MSWFSDFIENPQKSIDNALGTNFSGQGPGGLLSSGDIAKAVGLTAKNLQILGTTPVNATLDVAKGDFKSAGSRFVQSYGAVADFATGNMASLYSSDGGQKFLRNNLGLNNMAGFYGGITQARDTGTMSNQFRDETIRYGRDAAIIGGAAYAYSNPVIPTFGEAGAVSGKEIIGGLSWPGSSTLLTAGATKSLLSGNGKDFLKEIVGKDLADIIMPSPTIIQPSNPSDPTEFGPWNSPSIGGVGTTTSQGSINGGTQLAVIGAGILITYLVLKKVM